MSKQWKWIDGFEGKYKIYTDGKVWSEKTKKFRKFEILKVGTGYYQVGLWDKCKRKQKSVHRLIAKAFIPNPNNYKEVDHINGNSFDNRIENLRWANRFINMCNKKESLRKNNTTGYIGVYKTNSNWLATITSNGKTYYLGKYKTKEEGALAYNKKAKELNGDRAYQNKII